MIAFRKGVEAIMDGTAPVPVLIPSVEPPKLPGGSPGRPTLRRPSTAEEVKLVQAKVGVITDGNYGPKTEAAVRAFQQNHGLVPDGIVGPKTWAALDIIPAPGPVTV